MFIFDRLLVGGLRFVFDKLAQVADQELNDTDSLRERLLDAQMRHELGELDDAGLAAVEAEVLGRLRELEEARRASQGGDVTGGPLPPGAKIAGVEVSFGGDED
mgnify:CR=1 FL=1